MTGAPGMPLEQTVLPPRSIFTGRRIARIASAVLAMAFPSVCPSVRLSHAGIVSKRTTPRSTVQFALSDNRMCLVL